MITSNYRLTRCAIYKALKNYKGDDIVKDLSFALALNNLDILDEEKKKECVTEINMMNTYSYKGDFFKKHKQNAEKILRTLKIVKFKVQCKNEHTNRT